MHILIRPWSVSGHKKDDEIEIPVVPELENAVMKRGEDPGPVDVEGQALHPGGLRLKLGQHPDAVSVINIMYVILSL